MQTLATLRTQIDTLDGEILALLGKRFETIREVGKIKKKEGTTALQPKRWAEVQSHVKSLAQEHNIPESCVVDIYNIIHQYALTEEQ
jgi:para-aminobenzoate synthetase